MVKNKLVFYSLLKKPIFSFLKISTLFFVKIKSGFIFSGLGVAADEPNNK